jgi:ribosomal protein L40E
MTAPYREDSDEARYICIVCYAQTATTAEVCPRCAAPMQPLGDGEIVAELRKRAASKKKRVDGRRLRFVMVSSFVAAALVNAVLLWRRVYDIRFEGTSQASNGSAYVAFFFIPLFLWLVIFTLFDRVARRLDVFTPPSSIDPDKASVPDLLAWLGITPIRTIR